MPGKNGVGTRAKSHGNGVPDQSAGKSLVTTRADLRSAAVKVSAVIKGIQRTQASAETSIVNPSGQETGLAEADLIQKALAVIGSPERLAEWMRSSIPALHGQTPYSLMDSADGRKQVGIVLGRIEQGVY